MLSQTTKEFRKFFLLTFTKELIKNSQNNFHAPKIVGTIRPKQVNEENIPHAKNIPTMPFAKIKKQDVLPTQKMQELQKPLGLQQPAQISQKAIEISETKLPQRLQYLKPIPTKLQIDLGKLNPLVKDPMVKSIECDGPDKKITVKTTSPKITNISLNKEEISGILKKFSEATKIPIDEGVFRVAAGNLTLSAVTSEIVGTKFIIKKIGHALMMPQNPIKNRFSDRKISGM